MYQKWHADQLTYRQEKKKAVSLTVQANFQLLKPPHNTEMYCKDNQKTLL